MTLSSQVKRLKYVNYFNSFDIPGLENVRIDATRDTKGHTQMWLTFIFKVNHQGQMNCSEFSEIHVIVNVRIDTQIESAACIQPELRKVIQGKWVILSSMVSYSIVLDDN